MKKTITIVILCTGLTSAALGQERSVQPALIGTKLVYQSWSQKQTGDFNEFSVPLYVYYPVNRQFSVTLRGYGASLSGDNKLANLSGLADTQLGLSYFLDKTNLTFNFGINAPTGKSKLSFEEFETSAAISNNLFNLQVPNFGQGLNVSAGFTWAIPASEVLVLGLGASYQVKGGYQPIRGFIDDYKPGNEILITAGFNLQLGEYTAMNSDVSFTHFAPDRIGQTKVFAAGNRVVVSAQLHRYFNFNQLRLSARYRTRAKNELPAVSIGELAPEAARTIPNQFEIMGQYRMRFRENFWGRALLEGRFYQEAPGFISFAATPRSAGVHLFGFGMAPEWVISRRATIPIIIKYFTGSFDRGPEISGFEIGAEFWLSL